MKKIILLTILIPICFVLVQLTKSTPDQVGVRAYIYNDKGEEVWSNLKDDVSTYYAPVINGVPQIKLGQDVPLFESYLNHVNAKRLVIQINYGSGYELYQEFPIESMELKPRFEPEQEIENQISEAPIASKPVKVHGELPKARNPGERQNWRKMQKGGSFDVDKILAGRTIAEQKINVGKKEKFLRDAGIPSFQFRGPGNIGGRVRAIALKKNPGHPDMIFVGAAGGGLWKSENGGSTWQAINDFLPSLAVTSIVIDPKNDNIMYASTGEGQALGSGLPGAGIFKSTNGGSSWFQLSGTSNYNWITKMAIHPDNPDTLYASFISGNENNPSNNSGGLIRSYNGGQGWSPALGLSQGITDVDVHPTDPSIVTCSGIGSFWLSTNHGASFTNMVSPSDPDKIPSSSQRVEIAMAPTDVNRFYALAYAQDANELCQLYRSDNQGLTWSKVWTSIEVFPPDNPGANTSSIGNYANNIWVDPANKAYVYFGGVDLWETTNSGATAGRISNWKYYHRSDTFSAHGDQHIIVPVTNYHAANKKVFIGNDGGIQTTNNINTVSQYSGWSNLVNSSLAITQFYSGAVAQDGSPFGGGAQDNSFSTGTNTSNWKQPITGDGAYMAIRPDREDTIYANTNYNRLWVSYDRGLNWAAATYANGPLNLQVDLDAVDNPLLISPFVMDMDNPNRIFLGAQQLWRYNSNLETLVARKAAILSGQWISSIAVQNTGSRLWVGYTDGTIEFSTNSGTTWSGNRNNGAMPDNFVTDIALKPGTNILNEAIVALGGYSTNNIWRHRNGPGNTSIWTNISLDFPMQVNSVTYNPSVPNWIYIGTDVGIFASEDLGQNWSITPIQGTAGTPFGNEGPVYTEVTDLFWSGGGNYGPHRLWATTYGRGLWRSTFILDRIYVDKNYASPWGSGTFDEPYQTLKKAAAACGHGATIVFKSNGDHDEAPSSVVLDKRVMIDLTSGPVIIK